MALTDYKTLLIVYKTQFIYTSLSLQVFIEVQFMGICCPFKLILVPLKSSRIEQNGHILAGICWALKSTKSNLSQKQVMPANMLVLLTLYLYLQIKPFYQSQTIPLPQMLLDVIAGQHRTIFYVFICVHTLLCYFYASYF